MYYIYFQTEYLNSEFDFMRFLRFKNFMSMSTIKYLRYAIGEVILVVTGILIALQANNFNEERKFKIEQKTFLTGLKNELVLDTIDFRLRINLYEQRVENIREARKLMLKKKLNDSQKKVFRDAVLKMYR